MPGMGRSATTAEMFAMTPPSPIRPSAARASSIGMNVFSRNSSSTVSLDRSATAPNAATPRR
jgi:hypothetical protein